MVEDHFEREGLLAGALRAMSALESGAIANQDEGRMVGHYWLRRPSLAPSAELRATIESNLLKIKDFVAKVHAGKIQGSGGPFTQVLIIGIGGSALGPQFVSSALGAGSGDRLKPWFLDNTDPAGIDKVLGELRPVLGQTLCIVISKSGGTKETRNGMLEVKAAFEAATLNFAAHAVAITREESELDQVAIKEGWVARFPMWDWVGGRTSVTSAVGLLPAGLQGIDLDRFLAGAEACDAATRAPKVLDNPAALMALAWHHCARGTGQKNMVILPYKDRLDLLAKYLQQLIMESLGKHLDVNGLEVFQGLTVLGNKGSTDQHSYVQQLVDGVDNSFVTFVQVARDRSGASIAVEPDVTSGDYLHGFLLGTREALHARGRDSITVTVPTVDPFTIGALIALFERTVGFYASLVNINAYHQPGVEAGKRAAEKVIGLSVRIIERFRDHQGQRFTVEALGEILGEPQSVETIFHICEHLAANPDRGVVREAGADRFSARYGMD